MDAEDGLQVIPARIGAGAGPPQGSPIVNRPGKHPLEIQSPLTPAMFSRVGQVRVRSPGLNQMSALTDVVQYGVREKSFVAHGFLTLQYCDNIIFCTVSQSYLHLHNYKSRGRTSEQALTEGESELSLRSKSSQNQEDECERKPPQFPLCKVRSVLTGKLPHRFQVDDHPPPSHAGFTPTPASTETNLGESLNKIQVWQPPQQQQSDAVTGGGGDVSRVMLEKASSTDIDRFQRDLSGEDGQVSRK